MSYLSGAMEDPAINKSVVEILEERDASIQQSRFKMFFVRDLRIIFATPFQRGEFAYTVEKPPIYKPSAR